MRKYPTILQTPIFIHGLLEDIESTAVKTIFEHLQLNNCFGIKKYNTEFKRKAKSYDSV